MQLYVINWSFQNGEDQFFATNEFCEKFKTGKLNNHIEGFELKDIFHTPQNGSGVIVCKAQNATIIFSLLKMWRDSYSISFNVKPAFTNEELVSLHSSKSYWDND